YTTHPPPPPFSTLSLHDALPIYVSGAISAIRFYKSAQNTGPHTVNLWSASGVLLATATSVNETASGWQTVQLSAPVVIQANTTRSEEHTSELQSRGHLVCRLLLE